MPLSCQDGDRAVLFNRPYPMLVTDRATGEPFFMARVANPTTR